MTAVISGPALDLYLSDIKNTFRHFDYSRLKKMVFLNADSFLSFIDNGCKIGKSGKSFKEIIEIIEPFIPIVLSEESLNAYMLSILENNETELLRIQNQFLQNAKVLFIKTIINAVCDEDLEEIFQICRTIREYKELIELKELELKQMELSYG